MRKRLHTALLLSGAVLTSLLSTAQQTERVGYAITDVPNQNGNWVHLRVFNMETGQLGASLLDGTTLQQVAYDAASRKPIENLSATIADRGFNPRPAFSSGVAAAAYDKKNNRIWYTPMFIDQLRYIDLRTMKVYYVTADALTGSTVKSGDQGNIVTRMVIASDGNGYAMTNDGMQLIRFTTGKKVTITNLGAIADDQANKGVSVHNSCTSFGGDMIADDDGNIYAFSARNHVFKINVETKVATHLGSISGLPQGFTVNGAAVNHENKVIVASAMQSPSYFFVDMKSLAAAPCNIEGTVFRSSDLASSNLLATKPKTQPAELTSRLVPEVSAGDNKISIYPNPVTGNQFAVQFRQLEAGTYTIIVTDVTGRQAIQQQVNVSGDNQVQQIRMSAGYSKGVYLVKVMDQSSKAVYSTKVILQ